MSLMTHYHSVSESVSTEHLGGRLKSISLSIVLIEYRVSHLSQNLVECSDCAECAHSITSHYRPAFVSYPLPGTAVILDAGRSSVTSVR
jgi:hypothetical protein